MQMDERFINTYIEKLSKKLDEFTKLDILTQTQLEIVQQINTALNAEVEALKKNVADITAQLRTVITAREQETGVVDRKVRAKIKETTESF